MSRLTSATAIDFGLPAVTLDAFRTGRRTLPLFLPATIRANRKPPSFAAAGGKENGGRTGRRNLSST
jgi:hypothetical protein